ncbi:hypothetical protein CC79DRAFT_1363104 [Sarocladium strictum]
MMRLRPTTLSITTSELKDFELRSRYRKYLRTTTQAKPHDQSSAKLFRDPFEDRLSFLRPNAARAGSSSANESELEADQGFIYLGDVTRLSSIAVEGSTAQPQGVVLTPQQETMFERQDGYALDDPGEDASMHAAIMQASLSPRGSQDPTVTLPPPFSSRPRALSTTTSPATTADGPVPNLDGCDDGSLDTDLANEAELAIQLHDCLQLDSRSVPEPALGLAHRKHRSVDDSRARPRRRSLTSEDQSIAIHDDSLSTEHHPRTPKRLPEARQQDSLRGSHTAPISSRTRLGLSQASTRSGDPNSWHACPNDGLGQRAASKTASYGETEF